MKDSCSACHCSTSSRSGLAEAFHLPKLDIDLSAVPQSPLRRRRKVAPHLSTTLLFGLLCVFLSLVPSVTATAVPLPSHSQQSPLLFDSSPAPIPKTIVVREASFSTATTIIAASAEITSTPLERLVSSSTRSTLEVATSTLDSASLPSPFDSSLGNNFTQSSCPKFFESFLSDSAFKECLPLSLLLQTSNSFFAAERSPALLSETLDASCTVNVTACNALMTSYASKITHSSTCGNDYNAQNPLVLQAYTGFLAYSTLYRAGCLKNPQTGDYCFVDAATNTSSPTSSYIYYLPLGVSLPSTTQPTCNTCMQDTMAVFAAAAGNSSQPISGVYTAGAELVDDRCGDSFVVDKVAVASGAARHGSSSTVAVMAGLVGCLWMGIDLL